MKNRVPAIAIATLTFLLICLSSYTQAQPSSKTVTIDSGTIEGVASDRVLSFKGIPYAAPPVGNLRWRAPQPVAQWMGVRQATQYGNDCMQTPDPSDAAPPGTPPAEDCLVVNVWRPSRMRSGEKLPVMVWLHGGAFVNGGSSTPLYDGSAIAQEGVVVVSLNYRLSRFGFFAHPALTAANEDPLGNYGFLDQLAALRWVNRNVAAFGGDPNQVTLVGESAGGISIMHHLTSPEAKGLFHRAVVLSGGGRTYILGGRKLKEATAELPSAEESGVEFAKSVGITRTGAEALAALRNLPAETVAKEITMTSLLGKPPTYAGGPIFDGQTVTATPGEHLIRGEATLMPILIGSTSADLPGNVPPLRDPFSFFGANAAKARSIYDPNGTAKPLDLLLAIGVDLTMHEPARFVAKQMTTAGQPAWLYRFGYVAQSLRPDVMGAGHASELPYLFDTLDVRYPNQVTAQDRQAGRAFRTYIVNFVKTGNPNGQGLPSWTPYHPARSDLMMFTLDNGPRVEPDPWQERLDLVEQAANAQMSASSSASN
jgi:para-nitrobenzyl esterase